MWQDCVQWRDPWGKRFALVPREATAEQVRDLVIDICVANADTGYATAPGCERNDFVAEPFCDAEVERIRARQRRNAWSYRDVALAHRHGGRLVATPTGLLMGVAGSRGALGVFAQRGGTTWGDAFWLNVASIDDPRAILRAVVHSGRQPRRDGSPGRLALDRLLHHEERHARQWAERGHARFIATYLWEQVRGRNDTEIDAGLSDGGYE